MRWHRRWVSGIACGFICGAASGAGAGSQAMVAPLGREVSLGEKVSPEVGAWHTTSVTLGAAELPALLRFETLGAGKTASWAVEVATNGIVQGRVNGNAESRMESDVFVEIRDPGKLEVRAAHGSPPHLRLVGRTTVLDASALQRNGTLNLEYFESAFQADARRREIARAVVRIEIWHKGTNGLELEGCTGFAIGDGLFITNAHCVRPDSKIYVVFGSVKGNFAGEAKALAKVERIGSPTSADRCSGVDLALLTAEVPAGYAVKLSLASDSGIAEKHQPVEMIEQWQHLSKPFGKVLSRDEGCVASTNDTDEKKLSQGMLWHGCDTERGSSGSPLFVRNGDEVIGVHFFGLGTDKGGCALAAQRVRRQLAEWGVAVQ